MSLETELKAGVDKMIELTTKQREEVNKHDESINLLSDKIDAFDKDKIEKMTTDTVQLAETVQSIQVQIEANKKAQEEFAANLLRSDSNGTSISQDQQDFMLDMRSFFTGEVEYKKEDTVKLIEKECIRFSQLQGHTSRMKIKFSTGLLSGINSDGGFFVLPDRLPIEVMRIFETSPIRQNVRVTTTVSNRVVMPIRDNLSGEARWEGEIADTTNKQKNSATGELKINVAKLTVEHQATEDFLADSVVDVERWILEDIAERFMLKENNSFVTGAVLAPDIEKGVKGFMNETDYPDWAVPSTFTGTIVKGVYERNKIETIPTASAGVIVLDDLTNMNTILLSAYKPNSRWMMTRQTLGAIMKIKEASTERPLIAFDYMAEGAPMTLLGSPVIITPDFAEIGANALAIAFGDFTRGYLIVDRAGITILRDIYTKRGSVLFYARKRLGAGVTSFDSFKRLRVG